MARLLRAGVLLIGVEITTSATARPGFTALPGNFLYPTGSSFVPAGISGDGRVVVGGVASVGSPVAARWTAVSGVQVLTALGGWAVDVSFDGAVIVGSSGVWTASGVMPLPVPSGYASSGALAVIADGGMVVGNCETSPSIYYSPFRWTVSGGLQFIWTPPGPGISEGRYAADASADGEVVVGRYTWYDLFAGGVQTGNGWRWTEATGIQQIETPAGYSRTTPFAISKDGTAIVGAALRSPGPPWPSDAFRWTSTPHRIDPLAALATNWAVDVSADGAVVVGASENSGVADRTAWVWTESAGTRELRQLLLDLGVTAVSGWRLLHPEGISDDGSVVTGAGLNPLGQYVGWVAYLDDPCYPDCNADSALTVADFGCFQTKFVAADPYADCNADGSLTVADFGCFQSRFVTGCP